MKYTPPIGGEPNDPYIDANPAAGIEGSAVPAAAVEGPQRELHNLIDGLGGTPDPEDFTQVFALLLSSFAVASGRADQVFRVAEAVGQSDAVPLAQLEALLAVGSEGGKLRQITTFTATGTYTKPSWLHSALVDVQGGGGGGGGAAGGSGAAEGSGGGGGGYARKLIPASSIGATETVTVGDGGAGGAAGSNNGSPGGATSFGSHCTGNGGTSGGGGVNTTGGNSGGGGPGGAGVGGGLNISGGQGGSRRVIAGVGILNPYGGASHLGASRTSAAGNGNNGYLYGGGGSGGLSTTTDASGGGGAAGVCIVYEYE